MPVTDSQVSLGELQDWESEWLIREGIGSEEDRRKWLEEGVQLYQQFTGADENPRYYFILSRLYLDWEEAAKQQNRYEQQALAVLQKAIALSPERPDAYYHLTLVSADRDHWERVLVYGEKALECSLSADKQVRLLCKLAMAEFQTGAETRAQERLKQARWVDAERNYEWLLTLYEDQLKTRRTTPVLVKHGNGERLPVSLAECERIRKKAKTRKYLVLDLSQSDKHLYTPFAIVKLSRQEAGILGYLMEQHNQSCSRREIEEVLWPDREAGITAVRHYIAGLRMKLKTALNRRDIREAVLATDSHGGYQWKLEMDHYVLR